MNVAAILARLCGVRECAARGQNIARQWAARCPAHPDRRASLSIAETRDGRLLVKCHAGCTRRDILAALGLRDRDLFSNSPAPQAAPRRHDRPEAIYDYRDASGALLFQVVRFLGKHFAQRQPDGRGGWAWSLDGVPRVLYRLPDLLRDDPAFVCVVEGERDTDALAALGFGATCNPGGAGKWGDVPTDFAHRRALRRPVVVFADDDAPGRRHVADVARRVASLAKSVRIAYPLLGRDGAPAKDMAAWLDALRAAGADDAALRRAVLAAVRDAVIYEPGGVLRPRWWAARWLRALLAAGPRPAAEIRALAKASGFAWRTIRRGAESIGAPRFRRGFGCDGAWFFGPPPQRRPNRSGRLCKRA